jgi:hypothetical protein
MCSMHTDEHPVDVLPTTTRFLCEQVFVMLDATRGRWRIELEARDGVLTKWFRHEAPGGARELARFHRAGG